MGEMQISANSIQGAIPETSPEDFEKARIVFSKIRRQAGIDVAEGIELLRMLGLNRETQS